MNKNKGFRCAYCAQIYINQHGNVSHFRVGKICDMCNKHIEITRRLREAK